jgi:arylsulfatase I/J
MLPVIASLLLASSSPSTPHIVHVVADDLGWADVGYHRENATDEVHTPNIDELVKTGLELNRHYVHKICSPTRSAVQSGRAPIHVNVQNVVPESVNAKDPLGGFQGIPLNMTCIASQMKKANYKTHIVGK